MHKLLGAILLAGASLALGACSESEPAPPPRPPADITVAPGLGVVIGVSDAVLFSGASVQSGSATPLFAGRITPRGGQVLSAPAAPSGAALRLRAAPAPTVGRGEEMTWLKSDGPVAELPKTGATAEYTYSGGEVTVRLERGASGNLVFTVVPAPEKK